MGSKKVGHEKRQCIDIVIAWINGLRRLGGHAARYLDREFVSHSKEYLQLSYKYDLAIEDVIDSFGDISNLPFNSEARVEYLIDKARKMSNKSLVLVYRDGDPTKMMRRKELGQDILRKKYDKALHVTGTLSNGEWKPVTVFDEGVDRSELPPLPVFETSSKQYNQLDTVLKGVGKLCAEVEAIERVDAALSAGESFAAIREVEEVESISVLADKIVEAYPEDYLRENLGEVVRKERDTHQIRTRPDYQFNRKAYYDALYSALKRRLKR